MVQSSLESIVSIEAVNGVEHQVILWVGYSGIETVIVGYL